MVQGRGSANSSQICLCRRMVQGRGSANSSAKVNFAFADEWFKVGGRQIRRKFAFADEWFKVGGRQIRRQRQIVGGRF